MAEEGAGEGVRPPTPHVSVSCHAALVSFVLDADGAGWHASGRYVREDGTTKAIPERDSIVEVLDGDEVVTIASFRMSWKSRRRLRISCPRCPIVAEATNIEQLFPILDTLCSAGLKKITLQGLAARLSLST